MRPLALLALAFLPLAAAAAPSPGETKAQLCLLCHKPERDPVPLLEAQPAPYLVAATRAYQTGARTDHQMQPNVARLTPKDIRQIADHFAARAPMARQQTVAAGNVARGEQRVAELKCAGCHQSTFHGRERVPRLAGQSRGYLVSQLEAFAARRRAHPAAEMPAQEPADIESIASYLAALP
jgi:cytochrome c553